jgi:hypothetical protein
VSRACAIVLTLLATGGCTKQLYEGPKRPKAEVGTLDGTGTVLWRIDGERQIVHALGFTFYELSPGPHSLVVRYQTPEEPSALRNAAQRQASHDCSMILVVEAGARYRLRSRAIGLDTRRRSWDGSWEAWVEGDGERVAHCVSRPGQDVPPSATVIGNAPIVRNGAPSAAAASVAPLPTLPTRADSVTSPGSAPPALAVPELAAAPAGPAALPTPTAQSTERPTPQPAPEIRLGTWNLRGVGGIHARDVALIASIIDSELDIVTLTEVITTPADRSADAALPLALGAAWDWLVAPDSPTSPADSAHERYVIAYRRSVLRPCAGWHGLRVHEQRDGARFLRPPAFGCFQAPAGDAPPSFDFLLAVYRADWGDGDLSAVVEEVRQLDTAVADMFVTRPGERDLLVAGDFNLATDDVRGANKIAVVTRGDGSTLNIRGERTDDLYDHILIADPSATREMLTLAEALDVRPRAGSNAEFLRLVSDHLPVVIRLRALGPDDD